MKYVILPITFLAVVAFTVGCNKEQTTSQQIDKFQTETKNASEDMKDYTYAQKSEFTASMKSQLSAINADLDQLAAKIEKSNDATKAETSPKLQALREQASEMNVQLERVKNTTESTWDSVKAGTKKSYEALKDGFQKSRQWMSDKIAP